MMTQRHEGFDKDETIAAVEERVQDRFPDVDPRTVHDEAAAAVDRFADAPVKDFIDVIAERQARARIEEVADQG